MVVLVRVDALEHMVSLETQRGQFFENCRVYRNLRKANENATRDSRQSR